MPMRLDDGWNQIQFNLSDFTRRAYGTNYIETLRVQVMNIDEFGVGVIFPSFGLSVKIVIHSSHGSQVFS